jgi:hypothetical protein
MLPGGEELYGGTFFAAVIGAVVWYLAWYAFTTRRAKQNRCPRCGCDLDGIPTARVLHGGGRGGMWALAYCEPCAKVVSVRRTIVGYIVFAILSAFVIAIAVLFEMSPYYAVPGTLVVLYIFWLLSTK